MTVIRIIQFAALRWELACGQVCAASYDFIYSIGSRVIEDEIS
jgi:hypothetical protein